MSIDEGYTRADHEFRDDDAYAKGKYDLTMRWLARIDVSPRHLINVGCGDGLFNAIAEAGGFSVDAFEPDQAAAHVARQRAGSRTEVTVAGLFDLPDELTAPVVVLHDVLEHIADEAAAVVRLRRLLAPGGVVVISVPAMPSLFGLHDEQLGHHRRYTRATLRGALEPHFTIERMRYYGASFIPVTAWFSRFRRTPYPTSSVGGRSLLGRAFAAACAVESHVASPIGTSLVVLARP